MICKACDELPEQQIVCISADIGDNVPKVRFKVLCQNARFTQEKNTIECPRQAEQRSEAPPGRHNNILRRPGETLQEALPAKNKLGAGSSKGCLPPTHPPEHLSTQRISLPPN